MQTFLNKQSVESSFGAGDCARGLSEHERVGWCRSSDLEHELDGLCAHGLDGLILAGGVEVQVRLRIRVRGGKARHVAVLPSRQ